MQRDRQHTSYLAGAIGSIAIHTAHPEVTGQLDHFGHAGTLLAPWISLRDLPRPQDRPGFSTEALEEQRRNLWKKKFRMFWGRVFRVLGNERIHTENMAFLFCFCF